MDIFKAGMEPFFGKRLARREVELRHLIDSTDELMHQADEARAGRAGRDLEDVLAARRRLADHGYGQCADCGKAIDLGRLIALAATPCCTTCQAIREQDRTLRVAPPA